MRTANLWLALAALSQSAASAASAAAVTPARTHERAPSDSTRVWALDGTRHLSLIGVNASAAEYRGRKAVRLVEAGDGAAGGRDRAVAMIDDAEFHDGTIELWVAGSVRPGVADTSVRGFVGVVFRGAPDASRYENIYLRPTNGRSSDQVRRNHAVQYESVPDYPWFRLRQESPGKYEAYADLQPGEWTKMKVVVRGAHAELFVNDAAQPSLVVDDLKLGDRRGSVGLWIGPGTEAWFSQLRVSGDTRPGAAPGAPAGSRAQTAIPLNAGSWTATDGLKFVEYNGRPSLYIDRGVALARDVALRDGTIEMDMATPRGGNFMGVVFHASSARNSEVVFFRPGQSGTVDAMQYAPALNGVAAAWQMYHGEGANAAPVLAFDQWTHVKVDITGNVASIYLNDESESTMRVPRLAGVDGGSVGVWTGYFGRGAYYSNIRYTARAPSAPAPDEALPRGTIVDWELSQAFDAPALTPGTLPALAGLKWEKVHVEAPGFVLVNRYRESPSVVIPRDPATHEPLVDSIMRGRVAGSKVVLARTVIQSDRDEARRMLFGYSDGVVIYCNGRPLFFGMDPSTLRDNGDINMIGDAVYLPLRKGRNEVVLAVTEFTGGWGYWARLDP